MRKFIQIVVMIALGVLVCAPRADAAKNLSGGFVGHGAYRQEASFQNGDTGVVGSFDNICGSWSVSHFVGEGGGGVVEVWGSRGTTTADGQLLATLSTTSAAITNVSTGFPRIVVNINAAPASGTARTYFVCASGIAALQSTGPLVVTGRQWSIGFGTTAALAAGSCLIALPNMGSSGVGCAAPIGNTGAAIQGTAGRPILLTKRVCWTAVGHTGLDAGEELRVGAVFSQYDGAGNISTTSSTTFATFFDADDQVGDFVINNTAETLPYTGVVVIQLQTTHVGVITSAGNIACRIDLAEI